jgi:hypothetical protein
MMCGGWPRARPRLGVTDDLRRPGNTAGDQAALASSRWPAELIRAELPEPVVVFAVTACEILIYLGERMRAAVARVGGMVAGIA